MTSTPRCQPPEELLVVDGLHWIRHRSGREEYARWIPDTLDSEDGGFWWQKRRDVPPALMAEWGYRWAAAVPTTAQLTALVRAGRAVAALPGLSDAFDTPSIRRLAAALSHFRSIPDGE